MSLTASELGRFRPYLSFLARVSWDRRLQNKLDPSDLVQQTLLFATKSIEQFRGTTDDELAGWLRQILANILLEQQRHFQRDKRHSSREVPMGDILSESSRRISSFASHDRSPTENIEFNEQALQIATALESLPKDQLEALVLHYWQGHSIREISQMLGRSHAAIGGLVHRGLKSLRKELAEI